MAIVDGGAGVGQISTPDALGSRAQRNDFGNIRFRDSLNLTEERVGRERARRFSFDLEMPKTL